MMKSRFFFKWGITRIVFGFYFFVVKFPNPRRHIHFLQGCYANYSERWQTKRHYNVTDYGSTIVPSYFCAWFGLFQIMAMAEPLHESDYGFLKTLADAGHTDIKPANAGYFNGEIRQLDYP